MNEPSAPTLDALASHYAVRWSGQRPAREATAPATRTEPRRTDEAREALASLAEFVPDYSHSGINE